MVDVIILELITMLSFIYSLVLVFSEFAPMPEILLLFAWTVAGATTFAVLKEKSPYYQFSILLLLVPLVYFRDLVSVGPILLSAFLLFGYCRRSLLQGSRYDYVSNLRKAVLALVLAAMYRQALGLADPEPSGSLVVAAPFIMVLFLSSVALIRSIRHLESGLPKRKITGNNIKFIISISLAVVVFGMEQIREFMRNAALSIFFLFMDGIAKISELISHFFANLDLTGLFDSIDEGQNDPGGPLDPPPEEIIEGEPVELDFSRLEAILNVALFVVMFMAIGYILYRLLVKSGARTNQGHGYTEEREHLPRANKKKKSSGILNWFRRPEVDPIRRCYRLFLTKLAKRKVEILPTDTTQDVDTKAQDVVAEKPDRIRQIYLERRYGNKELGSESLKEMEELNKRV